MTPTEYCTNKSIHASATSRYNPNIGWLSYHEGQWYREEHFKKAFPVNVKEVQVINNFKGENPDRTRLWMED